jgi:hypothetical protein
MDDQFCVGLEDYLGKGLAPNPALEKEARPITIDVSIRFLHS